MPPAEELPQAYLALAEENAVLRTQIEWLRRQLFGGGKSEKLDRAQLLLKLGELEKLAATVRPTERVSYERARPAPERRPVAAEVFAHLPVKERIVIEPEEVKAEPGLYERIGEERTFEVDVTPPKLFKREIVRPKYRHRLDKARPPVVAAAFSRPVAGGYASAGLLAWVALSKYVDHLPLYRLEQMSARWGAQISRQTMADWIRIASEWLEPIYKHMHRELLAGGYVQADETPVKCNDPDEKRGGTSQGYLWVVSRPGGDVVFDWRLSRRHGELTTLLTDDYKGVLQSDGYEAYAGYARAHEGVVWVGCWAHARRKFFEAQAETPKAVRVALKLIGRLYAWERVWDEAGVTVADERARLRAEHFARPLRWLRALAQNLRARVLPRSLLGKACDYLLHQWEPLSAHVRHGQTRIDNNLIENAIRPSAIGKKNWLFIGHPDAGQRSAILYSLVVSCQRHGKDPLGYLRDVLSRLPSMTNQDDLAPLTPARWQPPVEVVATT
ncbi:MAG: IS66 family transposase [Opitutaceae bacterium]|jgi:transposase